MILRLIVIGAAALGFAGAALAGDEGDKQQSDAAAAKPVHAKRKHAVSQATTPDCCEPYRYAYAESWYGNKKIIAPVRHGPLGDEVLIPGGVWVTCQFSCEYIMRKQTLHYWEDQGAGSGSEFSPAYPREDSYVNAWGFRRGYLF